MNLQDMKQRRSVRTFDGKGLDPEMLAAMRSGKRMLPPRPLSSPPPTATCWAFLA